MVRREAEIVNVTQEQVASVPKAQQLSLDVQCVSVFTEEAKKLRERLSALETTACAKDNEGIKWPATRSKREKADVEVEVEQARVQLDARNAHVVELEALPTKLEKQLEQSAPKVHVAQSKYLLPYDDAQTLKEQSAKGVSYNG